MNNLENYYQQMIKTPKVFHMLNNLHLLSGSLQTWPTDPSFIAERNLDKDVYESLLHSHLIGLDKNRLNYYLYFFPFFKMQGLKNEKSRENLLRQYDVYFQQHIVDKGIHQVQLKQFLQCQSSPVQVSNVVPQNNQSCIIKYTKAGRKLARSFPMVQQTTIFKAPVELDFTVKSEVESTKIDLKTTQMASGMSPKKGTISRQITSEAKQQAAYNFFPEVTQSYSQDAQSGQLKSERREQEPGLFTSKALKYAGLYTGLFSGSGLYLTLFT